MVNVVKISKSLLSAALIGSLAVAGSTDAGAAEAPGLSALTPVGPFLFTFNENGQGTIAINGGPATTLNGVLAVDPSVPAGPGQQLA